MEDNNYWLIEGTPYVDFTKIMSMDWIIAVIITGRNQGKTTGFGEPSLRQHSPQEKLFGLEKYMRSLVL